MFSHIVIGVGDFERALAFYTPLAAVLGIELRFADKPSVGGLAIDTGPRPLLIIGAPYDASPCRGNGQMVAFLAASRAIVDRAHEVSLDHGGRSKAPGLRPEYHEHYYGAYFRDPDGNKLCVACHARPA